MHILPLDIRWFRWPFNSKIHFFRFSSFKSTKYRLDFLNVLISLVSYKGTNNICVILKFFLIFYLSFEFLYLIRILQLDSISTALKQIYHFLIVKDKINPCNLYILIPQFVLYVFIKVESTR